MALEAYSPCPCGSGKKFKWCCQPFYSQIERAYSMDANGQHDAAEAALDQLAQQFPTNAEIRGRQAYLLWSHGKKDAAEAALDKALELNPHYAMGHQLRGEFRHEEGEVEGALLLYRKAAELCDPAATDNLAEMHVGIARCELYRYRPIAAHAALEIARRLDPANEGAQNLETQYFGVESPYPSTVRKKYVFRTLPAGASAEKKQAWAQALAASQSGKLADALKAFEKLAQAHPNEPAVLYNLALLRAWLGDNVGALAALDHYVGQETNEEDAASAWAFAETLRQGVGMIEHSDWTEQLAAYRIQDANKAGQALSAETRLVDVQQHQGAFGAVLLDRDLPPVRDDLPLFELPRVAAHLVIIRTDILLTHQNAEMLAKAKTRLESVMGGAVAPQPPKAPRPLTFRQMMDYTLSIRMPQLSEETSKRLIDAALEQAFEEDWANRRLRSLGHRSPLEAMACEPMRPRVRGLVKLLEEVGGSYLPFPYDFAKLRGKLEAVAIDPAAKPAPPMELEFPTLSWKPKTPLAECSVAELNALPLEAMGEADLQQALQGAQRQQHPRLIATFAEALIAQPAGAGQDRFPLYQALIQAALAENDGAAAQKWVEAGLKFDAEKYGGKRQADYELAQARALVAAKDGKGAYETFLKLIQRQPGNLEHLGAAAEAMLKAGLRAQAAQFAESGAAYAKGKNDKSRASYFQELLHAARRG